MLRRIKRTVKVVFCAPDVERGRCANLFPLPCFELEDMLAMRCKAMCGMRGV
jgi:hypothetical protein